MTTTSTKIPPRDECALKAILARVEDGTIRLYRNVLHKPYIGFHGDDRPTGTFHLDDPAVRAWLSDFVWDQDLGLIHQRELDRIITVLAGRAMRSDLDHVSDPAALELVQTEPVVAVALEYMHIHPTDKYTGKVEVVWKEWREFARDRGLLKLGRKRFPGGANVLSRELAKHKRALEWLGIYVTIKRSNGAQLTITRRLDGSQHGPSPQSSTSNPADKHDLSPEDDKEARVTQLRLRKSKRTE